MTNDKTVRETSRGEHEVGYKKPPRNTQFRKGKSGNPAGRPKRDVDLRASLRNMLSEPIRVTIDGKSRNMSSLDAALLNLRTKMLNGERQALNLVWKMATTTGLMKVPEESQTEISMSSEDEQMLAQAIASLSMDDSSKESS